MKVGIQLYSVKSAMAKDTAAAIKEVVGTGYRYLEVANQNALEDPGIGFGISADEVNKILEESNSKIVSAHIYPLTKESIGPILEYHKKIGTKYLVCPMYMFSSYEDTKAFAIALNEVGKICKEEGISVLYHNHFHEFMELDGKLVMDIIMENSDPEYLGLEIDTFWAMRAGQDPVEVLKKYGKRVKLIHQKDYNKDLADDINLLGNFERNDASLINMESFIGQINPDSFVEIGKGLMDIQAIIDAGKEYCDVDYIILEQDMTKLDEMESIKVSMEEFKKFKGISFD